MVAKLNGYTLSDNSIDTMTSALGRSQHINKEIWITMCLRRDNIILQEMMKRRS